MSIVERALPRIRMTVGLGPALLIILLALSIGVAAGNPGTGGLPVIVLAVAAAAAGYVLSQRFAGFLLLGASCFILAVVAVTPYRYLNAFDLVLPFMFPWALFGLLRKEAHAHDALEAGPAHDAIRDATRKLSTAVLIFMGLAAVSLIPMVFRLGPDPTVSSTFILARGIEGVMMFPLGIWWLRSDRRVRELMQAVMVGGALFMVVNLVQTFTMDPPPRAALTWVVNHLDWPVEGPNEAGAALVTLIALLMAHHTVRPRARDFIIIGSVLFMLFLTLSRSGLLALITFFAFQLRRIPIRYVLIGALILGGALVFVPDVWWSRMTRSFTFERGTFEVFTFMIRVYAYQTNLKIFLDNWLFGLGYLAGRFVSQDYNDLKIAPLGAENFYIDTAAGMGVIGLAAMCLCFVRLFQLGRVVRRVTPPGTLGHEMARLHAPLVAGLMVLNLLGFEFLGLVSAAQLSLWCAMMIRSGHHAVHAAPGP